MWCSSRTNPSTMLQDVMFLRYPTSVFINITSYLKMWCPSRTNPSTMLYFTNILSFMHFTIFLNGSLGHLMPNNGIYFFFYHFNGINHNTRLIPDRAMTVHVSVLYCKSHMGHINCAAFNTASVWHTLITSFNTTLWSPCVYPHSFTIFQNIMATRFRYVFFHLSCNSFLS